MALAPEKDGTPRLRALEARLDSMTAARERMIPLWRDISRYIAPNRGEFDNAEPDLGKKRGEKILDASPARALGILQAGMQGGLTSPSRAWFKLEVSDPGLAAVPSVMRWAEDVKETIASRLAQSNIYNCLHGAYGELGAFGTAAVFVEDDAEDTLRGHLMTCGEYALSFDAGDRPDGFGRVLWMTAGQMAGAFGEDALSDGARSALSSRNPDKRFRVCHLVMTSWRGGFREPFTGVYWERGADAELGAWGYPEFPVLCPRWETAGASSYGYGPGWQALPESRTLQEMRRDYLIAQKQAIDPPMMAPEEARIQRVSLAPGAINYVTSAAPFQPVRQFVPDIPGQMAAMAQSREMIDQMFHADLFLMIASMDKTNMTATEVQVRQEEKMQMLGPVIERLEHELLDPLIARAFGIMNRRGMFPQPPDELAGHDVKIEYVSMLALAQRASGLGDLERLMGVVGGLAQMSPDVTDKLDADAAVDQFARLSNVPPSLVRDSESVAGLREARDEQRRQAGEMDAAARMAGAARQGAAALRDASAAMPEGAVEGMTGGGAA